MPLATGAGDGFGDACAGDADAEMADRVALALPGEGPDDVPGLLQPATASPIAATTATPVMTRFMSPSDANPR